MGGKIWSKEEEHIYWRVIVPQSDKRAGRRFSENHKSWGDLAKIMQSLMGDDARREYTHLSLCKLSGYHSLADAFADAIPVEHYFQNIKKRPSPNAIGLVMKHKKARNDAGQDPDDTTEPKDESSQITDVNMRDVIAEATQDADSEETESNHMGGDADDGNAGHDGPATVDQPANSTVSHSQTPVAQMGVNVPGLSTTAQGTPTSQLYQSIIMGQRRASASEPKRAPAHRYNYRSSPYDTSRTRGPATPRQQTRGTADGSAPAHPAGNDSYLPTPGYDNQTPQTQQNQQTQQTQQNNYAGGWMSQNQPRPTAGYHMGPGPQGSLVGHRFKTPVNDGSYGAYQGLPQTHSQQPRFDSPQQLTGGHGTHQPAYQQTQDGGNNTGTYGQPDEAQSPYNTHADEHSENNGYNVVDTQRALSQARESYYSRRNSAHGAMSQSYQTSEPQSLKLPPIRDVLQFGSPYDGQCINPQATQYSGQHAGQPAGQYASSYDNRHSAGQYASQSANQYASPHASSQYARPQYASQYTNQFTNQYTNPQAGHHAGQYDGQYASQTTGQYADQNNTPYAHQYSGQYAYQRTTPSASQYPASQYAGNTGQYASPYTGQNPTPYDAQNSQGYTSPYTGPNTGTFPGYNTHRGAPAAEQQVHDDRESHTAESEGAAESQWAAKLHDEFVATFGQPHGQDHAAH